MVGLVVRYFIPHSVWSGAKFRARTRRYSVAEIAMKERELGCAASEKNSRSLAALGMTNW
jgi:hypothetical protein